MFGTGWQGLDLGDGRTLFGRGVGGRFTLEGATIGPLAVGYAGFEQGWPREVRIAGGTAAREVQLLVKVSQVEENPALGPDVFELKGPPDATPMTLDELRARGPGGVSS